MARLVPLLLAVAAALVLGPGPASARDLAVGVAGAPPFVIVEGDQLDGLSVQVWSSVAQEMKVAHRLVPYPTVADGLKAVEDGKVDVLVGPVTITAQRMARMTFSQPYFRSSLGIMASTQGTSLLDRLRPFLSRAFMVGAAGLLALLVVVGALIWLAERGHDESQFPRRFLPGLGDGIWLALTTMSTVGYGDRYPVSVPGRIVTGLWILLSMGLFSTLTAAMATAFTLSQIGAPSITSAEMLAGKRVAVVQGTVGVEFALQHRAQVLPVDHLQNAILLLEQGQADAVVHDRPELLYYHQQHPQEPLLLSAAEYEQQSYGFAMPLGSPLVHKVNVALLELAETGALGRLETEWLLPR